MEYWKNLDNLLKIPVESLFIQSELSEDNHLWICIFTYIEEVEYQIVIDFGQILSYEILQEWMVEPKFLEMRSKIELRNKVLFEIFNSKILQELERENVTTYHHYFIRSPEYYLECVTTGIESIEVR